LIDSWARERAPGEICPAAGIEFHKMLSTMHPKIPGFARLQTAFNRRVFKTTVLVSTTPNFADVCDRSTLGLEFRTTCSEAFVL
jgi:hypothetical protein